MNIAVPSQIRHLMINEANPELTQKLDKLFADKDYFGKYSDLDSIEDEKPHVCTSSKDGLQNYIFKLKREDAVAQMAGAQFGPSHNLCRIIKREEIAAYLENHPNERDSVALPKKSFYRLPGKEDPFTDDNYIVLAEKLKLRKASDVKYLNGAQTRILFNIHVNTGLGDIALGQNVTLTEDGKVAIFDTEDLEDGVKDQSLLKKGFWLLMGSNTHRGYQKHMVIVSCLRASCNDDEVKNELNAHQKRQTVIFIAKSVAMLAGWIFLIKTLHETESSNFLTATARIGCLGFAYLASISIGIRMIGSPINQHQNRDAGFRKAFDVDPLDPVDEGVVTIGQLTLQNKIMPVIKASII